MLLSSTRKCSWHYDGFIRALWGWFPGPFLDKTFKAFEAFEGPRVEGGGGGGGGPPKGRKPSKASNVRMKALKPPSKLLKASKPSKGEDEAPFRVSNKPNKTHTETLFVAKKRRKTKKKESDVFPSKGLSAHKMRSHTKALLGA